MGTWVLVELLGPGSSTGKKYEAAESYYADIVSSNLRDRIVMEKNLVQKRLDTLNQETTAVPIDWDLIKKYLVDFNPNDKDEQEKNSNLQTQHHDVGSS